MRKRKSGKRSGGKGATCAGYPASWGFAAGLMRFAGMDVRYWRKNYDFQGVAGD